MEAVVTLVMLLLGLVSYSYGTTSSTNSAVVPYDASEQVKYGHGILPVQNFELTVNYFQTSAYFPVVILLLGILVRLVSFSFAYCLHN